MVFKDMVSSRQAQKEMAEMEKQVLLKLKNKNPNKNTPVNWMAPTYLLPPTPVGDELAVPFYKPHEMEYLKKLLDLDDTNESCLLYEGTNFVPEVLENALIKYVNKEFKKYKASDKLMKAQLIAQGYSASQLTSLNWHDDCDDDETSEDEDDGYNTPQSNIIMY